MTLHVLATFVARPDTIDEVRRLLSSLVDPIRADAGCTSCHFVVDVERPTDMVFIEQWVDDAALTRHLADPAIGGVVEQVAPLLAQPFVLARLRVPG